VILVLSVVMIAATIVLYITFATACLGAATAFCTSLFTAVAALAADFTGADRAAALTGADCATAFSGAAAMNYSDGVMMCRAYKEFVSYCHDLV
jgi:hypothetical protein